MSDQRTWEKRFVNAFVRNIRRPRYKTCLPDETMRSGVLERLNHSNDFDPDHMTRLEGQSASVDGLQALLAAEGVAELCWLMSDDDALDGQNCSVTEGTQLVASANWGTVMICPPRPIAIYRPEASEMALYLLKSN